MAIDFPDNPTNGDVFTSGGRRWEFDGSRWSVVSADAAIGTGSIDASKLAADSVTEAKIASSAVTAGKIGAAAVTEAKLGTGAVTADKIGSSAVTEAKIASSAVSHSKLASNLSAITVCTAGTKPASPFDGQVIYMTDVDQTAAWDGSAWVGIERSRDRNVVINGAMQVAQRGSTALSVAVNVRNYGPVDRFYGFGQPADGVYSIEQSTDVPASSNFTNSFKATCTTADASLSSGNQYAIGQMIEGTNSARLRFGSANAATVTLSFWVKSSLTGTYCCSLRNSSTNRSYVAEYSIAAADTWEKKSITIAGDTTGTWLTTTGAGIRVDWCLAAGTDLHAANATWSAGSKVATSNQVNWLSSSSSRTFFLTGVQLEAGAVATPFEFEDYGTTLAKCQRYFEKSYNVDTPPGTATTLDQAIGLGIYTNNPSAYNRFGQVYFKVSKRAIPTVTQYAPWTGSTAAASNASAGDGSTAVGYTVTGQINTTGFNFVASVGGSTVTNYNTVFFAYTASAEL